MRLLGNGVFQEYIEQHEFFEEIMPNSASTLRITSFIEDSGHCSIRGCFLRMGRTEDTHVKSVSQVRVPINFNTGELDAKGYLTTWCEIDRHPDTKVVFFRKENTLL